MRYHFMQGHDPQFPNIYFFIFLSNREEVLINALYQTNSKYITVIFLAQGEGVQPCAPSCTTKIICFSRLLRVRRKIPKN